MRAEDATATLVQLVVNRFRPTLLVVVVVALLSRSTPSPTSVVTSIVTAPCSSSETPNASNPAPSTVSVTPPRKGQLAVLGKTESGQPLTPSNRTVDDVALAGGSNTETFACPAR
jgi:hypothetical protein